MLVPSCCSLLLVGMAVVHRDRVPGTKGSNGQSFGNRGFCGSVSGTISVATLPNAPIFISRQNITSDKVVYKSSYNLTYTAFQSVNKLIPLSPRLSSNYVQNLRSSGRWDVIALQEVWHARERDALRKAALAAGLRYSRHFEHGCGAPIMGPGAGGTGLLVLSRFPIVESFFWVGYSYVAIYIYIYITNKIKA